MTTFAQGTIAPRPQPAPWSAALRLVVRWNAVDPATRRPFVLEWSIRREGDALLAAAALDMNADAGMDNQARRALGAFTDVPVRWTHDQRLRLDHFDAPGHADTDLPMLNVSVDLSGQAPILIFARTSALAALGLPGGRYEPAGASLAHIIDD